MNRVLNLTKPMIIEVESCFENENLFVTKVDAYTDNGDIIKIWFNRFGVEEMVKINKKGEPLISQKTGRSFNWWKVYNEI